MLASTSATSSALPLRDDLSRALRSARTRIAATTLALITGATATVDLDAARWFGFRGPECLVGLHFGAHVCPACGLVRSVASSVQGNFDAAFRFHPAGPILLVLALAILVLDVAVIQRSVEPQRTHSWRDVMTRVGGVALLLGWMARWTLST